MVAGRMTLDAVRALQGKLLAALDTRSLPEQIEVTQAEFDSLLARQLDQLPEWQRREWMRADWSSPLLAGIPVVIVDQPDRSWIDDVPYA